jgi:hypothetical protein
MTDIRARLNRALEHVQALHEARDAFLEREGPSPEIEFESAHDLGTEREFITVNAGPAPEPPTIFGIYIGEALYQFRACLNHLICELARRNGGQVDASMEFPIFSSAAGFGDRQSHKSAAWRRIHKLSESDQALLEQEQPFKVYESCPCDDPLWHLHELSNFDRHKSIHVAVPWIRSNQSDIHPVAVLQPIHVQTGKHVSDIPIARYQIVNPGPAVDVEVRTTVEWDIAFALDSPVPVKLVIQTLSAIGVRVADLVEKFGYR